MCAIEFIMYGGTSPGILLYVISILSFLVPGQASNYRVHFDSRVDGSKTLLPS